MKCYSVLLSLVAIVALGPQCFGQERPLGQSDESYAKLFLDSKDLSDGMKLTQNARDKGADPKDEKYADLKGQRSGFNVWMAKDDSAPMWRLVDIRLVFPDAAAAKEYVNGSLDSLSEGTPEDATATKEGDECHVYGPESPVAKALGVEMRAYCYVFRKGNVVVKLFVAQGANCKDKLQSKAVEALASKIVARLEEAGK